MIQEVMEKANQYYTGFVNLPVEGQVIAGIGLIVVLVAFKNVWGVLYPVRWTAANLLRITAFLMHPRKRKQKVEKAVALPIFDINTKKAFNNTIKYYAKTQEMAQQLNDTQLKTLSEAGAIYSYSKYDSGMGYVNEVLDERAQEADVRALRQPQLTPAPVPVPVIVERASPSEADIA